MSWLKRQSTDKFVKLAPQFQYRSRAAFKLYEIQQKFKVIRPNANVLDLGAAPGSWTQVVVNELGVLNKEGLVGQKPLIVSVDLHHIEEIEGATIIKGDIMDPKILKQLALMASSNADDVGVNNVPLFDAIVSDMAHPFTGSKSVDVPRVHQLVELALEVAKQKGILRKGGNFVAKYLNGQGDQELKNHVASHFEKIYTFKPKACRDSSTEAYFVALGFKRS